MNDLHYQLLDSRQAHRLKAFIEEIYGDSYPSELFYDPALMAALIEHKRLYSSVAMDGDRIVGHLASYLEHADDITADGISGMVLPEYRGHNIMSELARPMLAVYEQKQLLGLHLYAVTLHQISQRKTLQHGAVITGLLLADWPGDYRVEGFEKPEHYRMPMVMLFFPLLKQAAPERRVYCPERYRDILLGIYQQLELNRELLIPPHTGPSSLSRFYIIDQAKQSVATLRFLQIGSDWQLQAKAFEARHRSRAALYLDFPLDDPATPLAVDQQAAAQWYFGGVLIERNHCDYLRLQCSSIDALWPAAELTEPAQQMLDFILEDSRPTIKA